MASALNLVTADKADFGEDFGEGSSCWFDMQCPIGMNCLGVNPQNFECGYVPARHGDYCNVYYTCADELVCYHGACEDYANLLGRDDGSETCEPHNPTKNMFKIMTYNVFLLACPLGSISAGRYKCQSESQRRERVKLFESWFKNREEDVIIMQELYTLTEEVIEKMNNAGYCHYVMNIFGTRGSGLAIFSKWPIVEADFIDWFDAIGIENPDHLTDKGVMYAKIDKQGKKYHVFNAHAQPDADGINGHQIRETQYYMVNEFVADFQIPADELIMMGGDFNEDFYEDNKPFSTKYLNMISKLGADINEDEFPVNTDLGFYNTKNTEHNLLLKNLWSSDPNYQPISELLDYVFISKNGNIDNRIKVDKESFCEILIPQVPAECDEEECMLSDHFPNTCTFLLEDVSKE